LAAWEAERGGALPPNLTVVLDMQRSGARIAYDHFELETWAPHMRPLVEYVQDHDLWAHALPASHAVAAGFDALSLEYDVARNPALWDTLASLTIDGLRKRGEEWSHLREELVAAAVRTAYPLYLPAAGLAPPLTCLAATVDPADARHRSELGHALAMRAASGVGAVVYAFSEGRCKVSLRGRDGGVDTTAYAEQYRGGGHRAASSFIVPWSLHASWQTDVVQRSEAGQEERREGTEGIAPT
jgi:uncharacterized protein